MFIYVNIEAFKFANNTRYTSKYPKTLFKAAFHRINLKLDVNGTYVLERDIRFGERGLARFEGGKPIIFKFDMDSSSSTIPFRGRAKLFAEADVKLLILKDAKWKKIEGQGHGCGAQASVAGFFEFDLVAGAPPGRYAHHRAFLNVKQHDCPADMRIDFKCQAKVSDAQLFDVRFPQLSCP